MPISCHFRDCKALLVTSLTHVSGAITSVQTFPFTFSIRETTHAIHESLEAGGIPRRPNSAATLLAFFCQLFGLLFIFFCYRSGCQYIHPPATGKNNFGINVHGRLYTMMHTSLHAGSAKTYKRYSHFYLFTAIV